jgi:hypothetical protein
MASKTNNNKAPTATAGAALRKDHRTGRWKRGIPDFIVHLLEVKHAPGGVCRGFGREQAKSYRFYPAKLLLLYLSRFQNNTLFQEDVGG